LLAAYYKAENGDKDLFFPIYPSRPLLLLFYITSHYFFIRLAFAVISPPSITADVQDCSVRPAVKPAVAPGWSEPAEFSASGNCDTLIVVT
jgi:hypothetical protein